MQVTPARWIESPPGRPEPDRSLIQVWRRGYTDSPLVIHFPRQLGATKENFSELDAYESRCRPPLVSWGAAKRAPSTAGLAVKHHVFMEMDCADRFRSAHFAAPLPSHQDDPAADNPDRIPQSTAPPDAPTDAPHGVPLSRRPSRYLASAAPHPIPLNGCPGQPPGPSHPIPALPGRPCQAGRDGVSQTRPASGGPLAHVFPASHVGLTKVMLDIVRQEPGNPLVLQLLEH